MSKEAEREIKRNAAVHRQAERDKRGPAEQLAELAKRPGEAKRERARLTALLPPEPVKVPEVKAETAAKPARKKK